MRLWSLHPRYLDPQGLVALWREALLAQAVLRGETRGYRHHPQLERFRKATAPRAAMAHYLTAVRTEALARGYNFDGSKIHPTRTKIELEVTQGQLMHEWQHLLAKLAQRKPELRRLWAKVERPDPHPLFAVRPGEVEAWERV